MRALTALEPKLLAVLALVLVTAIWGSTFVIIKDAITTVDPSDFLFVRFLLASAVLGGLLWRRLLRTPHRAALIGVGIGGVYGLAQLLQTWGLASTSASVSGFLTGAYVVLTPFVAFLVVRSRVTGRSMAASVIALVGIAVLSLTGLAVGGGEALTLLSAVVYALHIVLVGRFAHDLDAIDLTAFQMFGITAVVGVAAIPGGVPMPTDAGAWGAILYTALVASIGVLFLQSWAQRHVSAAATAVVMALEPIFATLFAIAFGGEVVTGRLLLGGALILGAILLATVGAEEPELAPGPTGDAAGTRGATDAPPSVDPDPDDLDPVSPDSGSTRSDPQPCSGPPA
ncbi:DMT family transporter [Brachybacterium sp. YJGR34]|uniref:DMT family transporter n=1 Tax=Brachybacterium sp. YJGR34 TaxID=2059911 RepID=UPI000E0C7B79|nr:DMT family transporter [Brachybacterium sp. YJGR34]